MPDHPLAEVFGFPTDNLSEEASRYRRFRLCPFSNKVPNCTKDKASDPLGVCSIFYENDVVITCPVRFRQQWTIAEDAAAFFFPADATWTSLTEVRLLDKFGKSAGNIDIVLAAYDDHGRIIDYGALEVQAVYISGNVREPFKHYLSDPAKNAKASWRRRPNYPRPDYLSSSRKRLAPQLIFKGGILKAWNKKIAVALNTGFYRTLPPLKTVSPAEADMAWLVYDLQHNAADNRYTISNNKTVYTRFDASLDQITKPRPGNERDFFNRLQTKLDERLGNGTPPDAPTLDVVE